MKRLTLLLFSLMMLTGLALAQPYTFDIVNADFDEVTGELTFYPLMFGGAPVPQLNLIQMIKPGPNLLLDPPNSDGTVGNDDLLAQTFFVGEGSDMDGIFSLTPTAFPVGQAPLPSSLTAGQTFYMRYWYNNPPVLSTPVPNTAYYQNSNQSWTVPSVGGTVIWGVVPTNIWHPIFTGAPEIDVTPTSHNFGNVTVGQTASTTITINNTGTANLTVNNIQISGAGFSLSGLPTFPATVAPSGSVTFTVNFSPTAVQSYNGTVTISSNDSDEPTVSVPVSGTGTPIPVPEIDVTPTSHDFGPVTVGQTASITVTINNTGTANLIVSNIQLAGAGFSLSGLPAFPATVAPAGSATFTVNFTPTAVQAYNGTVTISSNDSDEPTVNVSVTGTGTPIPMPEIDVTPVSYDFGTVTVGQSASTTITVSNTGTANLIVNNIQLVGAAFSMSGLPAFPATVVPAGSFQFTVTFTPTAAQAYSGTVYISSNDADEPSLTVDLSGTGQVILPPEGPMTNPGAPSDPWNPTWGNHPDIGGLPAFEASFSGGPGIDNPTSLNFDLDDPSNMHPAIAWDMSRLADGYIGLMWVITPTGGTNFNATLTFRFLGAHLPGAPRALAPTTPLYARGFNRTTLTWGYLFGHIPGEVTWTVDDRGNSDPLDDIYTVTVNGVTAFSDWFLSEDSELPVQLSSFNAAAGDSRVNLSWVTESEFRNAYFKIERRVSGGSWTEIARVNSRAGISSATRLVYSYIDRNVVNGTTYEYRISDVSVDGVVSRYPRTVTATPRAEVINDYAITNYPNPFNPETKISFTLRDAGAVKLTITNVMGQNVATLINGEVMDRGTHNIVWNAGNLPSGIYLLRYEVNGFTTISKLVLSR